MKAGPTPGCQATFCSSGTVSEDRSPLVSPAGTVPGAHILRRLLTTGYLSVDHPGQQGLRQGQNMNEAATGLCSGGGGGTPGTRCLSSWLFQPEWESGPGVS